MGSRQDQTPGQRHLSARASGGGDRRHGGAPGYRQTGGNTLTAVRIDARFCGPPDSANGGYFAGLLARELGGSDVIVSLKQPAPLNVDLTIEADGATAMLKHGAVVLATAERAEVEIVVPEPPSLADAIVAADQFDQAAHIYPGCFVCGPSRRPGDGWRLFPGPVAAGRVAAGWTPTLEFAAAGNMVKSEFVWAALDCPGYFAVQEAAGRALLGRMGVTIREPVPADRPLVVQGWAIGSDGRKHHAGTSVHDSGGRLLAAAIQTWITLR